MALLDDPSMKEVVDEFVKESLTYLEQLEEILYTLEENPKLKQEFEQFGQIIDRIMGAAKSLGATEIGTFCELGKIIGYKSGQSNDTPLKEVTVAILFDAIDLLKKMFMILQEGKDSSLKALNTNAFASRLKWLSDKYKNIDRSSVSISAENMEQQDIDSLIKNLGL